MISASGTSAQERRKCANCLYALMSISFFLLHEHTSWCAEKQSFSKEHAPSHERCSRHDTTDKTGARCCETLNSHRFDPLFEKPGLIDHQHCIRFRKCPPNVCARCISRPLQSHLARSNRCCIPLSVLM